MKNFTEVYCNTMSDHAHSGKIQKKVGGWKMFDILNGCQFNEKFDFASKMTIFDLYTKWQTHNYKIIHIHTHTHTHTDTLARARTYAHTQTQILLYTSVGKDSIG